jgi:regulator of protease activity HflC (stomatin/prohibitin superfamily)
VAAEKSFKPILRSTKMIFFSILLVVGIIIGVSVTNRLEDEYKVLGRTFVVACGVVLIFSVCRSFITIVPAGHVGIPITFGSVGSRPLPEGISFVNPFCNVELLSVQTENYWMSHVAHEGQKKGDDSVIVRSSDGLQMPVDVSVPYRLMDEQACWVWQNLGKNYVEKILRPALSTATRRAAAKYTAEQLYSTKLEEFSTSITPILEDEINNVLNKNYSTNSKKIFSFSQVLVGYIQIPDSVKTAIENKLKADQEQQAMEFQIMKAKKEAERKRVEAEGIQAFQEIVKRGIDDQLLKWKAIEATLELSQSPNSKVIIIGGGRDGLPVLLNDSGDAKVIAAPKK